MEVIIVSLVPCECVTPTSPTTREHIDFHLIQVHIISLPVSVTPKKKRNQFYYNSEAF
jgi:hypothetical protein